MTLRIVETGEIVDPMGRVEAERVTAQIADKLDGIADNLELVMPLIREALTREAWRALGYTGAPAYVADRFKGSLTRLPRELRTEVVRELSDAGMSTRAIAPVVGASQRTVANDVSNVAHLDDPTPPPAPGQDHEPDPAPDQDQTPAPDQEAAPCKITGRDGKTYTRPVPAEPKRQRRAITEAWKDAHYDLDKKLGTLKRLTEDDRFARNRDELADRNLNRLRETASTLAEVLAALEG